MTAKTSKYPRKTKKEIYDKLTYGMNSPKFEPVRFEDPVIRKIESKDYLGKHWKFLILYNALMSLGTWFLMIFIFISIFGLF